MTSRLKFYLIPLVVSLFGCNGPESPFQEVMDMPEYIKSELIKGEYVSARDSNVTMIFGQQLTIQHEMNVMIKPYRINGSKVYVKMQNSTLESRGELELIFDKQNKKLFCTACGQFGLDSVWSKIQ